VVAQFEGDPDDPFAELPHCLLQSFALHGLVAPPALQLLCVVVQVRAERPIPTFFPLLGIAVDLKVGAAGDLHLLLAREGRSGANLIVPVWGDEEVVDHALAANNLRL